MGPVRGHQNMLLPKNWILLNWILLQVRRLCRSPNSETV